MTSLPAREPRSLLDALLVPSQSEYLVVDQNLIILATSSGVKQFADSPDEIIKGKDARLGFPELIGAEEKLKAIAQKKELLFELKAVARTSNTSPFYFNLYATKPNTEEFDEQLLLLFEDVTERMVLEQALVQRVNETNLLISALTTSKAYIHKIITSMADALLVTTPSGTIKTINRAAQELFGYRETELLKKPISIIIEDEAFLRQATDLNSLSKGEFLQDREVVCWTKHREAVYVAFSCSAVQTEIEGIHDLVYVGRDITERKRAEEQIKQLNAGLQQRTVELEAANKELSAFSHTVAHDLRAPLTQIHACIQLMLLEYADQLDTEGQDLLQLTYSASQRMGQLINDILRLSQVTHRELKREEVDLSSIAQSIVHNLRKRQPERQVEWVVTPDILAEADRQLIKIVLENLLGNAWKYTGKQSQPCIEFGVIQQESTSQVTPAYFVRDNGAGFDMAFADKLFAAFQRLHTDAEFEGTGVGLATVQRIINRHGGQIWANSAVGQGATFYFTLQ